MICNECETVAHCMKKGCVPKTTKKDEAMKLALEAYMAAGFGNSTDFALQRKAYDLAMEALAEQPAQQEPVAWIEHEWSGTGLRNLHFEKREPAVRDEVVNPVWTPLYTSPAAQQSCYCPNCEALGKELAELKAQPAQRKPLTDEQTMAGYKLACSYGVYESNAFALTDKMFSIFKEKNT